MNGEIGEVVCSNFMFVRGYVRVEPVRLVHSEPWEKVEPNMGKKWVHPRSELAQYWNNTARGEEATKSIPPRSSGYL